MMTSGRAEQAMRRLTARCSTTLDGGELLPKKSSGERREEKKPQRAPAR